LPRTILRPDIDPSVRDVLRVYFDAITLSESAQFALWQSAGLTLTQFGALRQLRGGPLPAGKLAAKLGISPTSLTRLLDRLESSKLVERRRDAADRRRISVALLPLGHRLLDDVSVLEGTVIHRAAADLTHEERGQILASLGRLVELARQHAAADYGPAKRSAKAAG
jgi:DNA-binding MarR family transcriptional regulator